MSKNLQNYERLVLNDNKNRERSQAVVALDTVLQRLNSKTTQKPSLSCTKKKKNNDLSSSTSLVVPLVKDITSKMLSNISQSVENNNSYVNEQSESLPLTVIKRMLKPLKIMSNSSSTLTSDNFSPSQFLYVPVNARELLTDLQWVDTLSLIESSTRDSFNTTVKLDKKRMTFY